MTDPTPQQQMEARAREYREMHSVKFYWNDADIAAFALREIEALQKAAQAFLDKVKELEPHVDSLIVLQSIRAGNSIWHQGSWASERDKLATVLESLPSPPEGK